ncbi:MAG: Uma2 family endonuclease [Phormidesmis sp.]
MTVATKRWTLAEYLSYGDGTDAHRYELENGEIVKMPSESHLNQAIAIFLLLTFSKFVSYTLLRMKTEMQTSGSGVTVRIPDVMVLSKELDQAMTGASRGIVLAEMPSPQLVVEVVSPGKEGHDRDYRYKRSEYAARAIREYWIVDAIQAKVVVLTLVDGLYEEETFTQAQPIKSLTFPELELTANQVLQKE